MHHVNLPMEIQYQLFGENFTTVTLLDGLTVIELNGKYTSHYKHFIGEMPGFAQNLHTVGEAGTVKIKMNTTPKLEDHGVHCLFVGYSLTHPTVCYRMYDPKCTGCMYHMMLRHYIRCSIRKQTLWVNSILTIIALEIGQTKNKGCHDSLKWGREFLIGLRKHQQKMKTLYWKTPVLSLLDLLLSGDPQCFLFTWYLVLKIACLHVSFTAYENFYKLSKMYCLRFGFPFSNHQNLRIQKSNNQTYIHLYTDFIIHKYICDRSLSGDPFHIVNPFLNAKGLFKCDSTHIPNKISARQSVCLSISDLDFNILAVDSHFG